MTLRDLFLLDPQVSFLNHGSFGATPQPVFAAYQEWQRRLESEPVRFIIDELPSLLAEARARLGAFLHAPTGDLVFIPNATFGVNIVARSLDLKPGDEVLTTDHEYGACDKTWEFICARRGARYIHQPVPLGSSPAEMATRILAGITPRTRLIFFSHITSPTAVTFPVNEICKQARQRGILTLVDGAHAPGQIDLDLKAIGADFYTGNCHKWLMAPKGSAFVYARPQVHSLLQPLVVGWGWQPDPAFSSGSRFIDLFQWLGTNDPSAYLAVPSALAFRDEHDWPRQQSACHALLKDALQEISTLTGLESFYPSDQTYHQMAAMPLPPSLDPRRAQRWLYENHRVQIPLIQWQNQIFIRISVQAYNTRADMTTLLKGLKELLANHLRETPIN